jgi:hypothetical protein
MLLGKDVFLLESVSIMSISTTPAEILQGLAPGKSKKAYDYAWKSFVVFISSIPPDKRGIDGSDANENETGKIDAVESVLREKVDGEPDDDNHGEDVDVEAVEDDELPSSGPDIAAANLTNS